MARKKTDDGSAPALPVRRVSLDDLHADPGNVNTHDDRNLSQIRASLLEYGQVEPLVVQKGTGKVIGGNGRLEVMQSLGWTHCDVAEFAGTPTQAAALGIMLNRSAKTSVFDDVALARTLEAIRSEPDFPLAATGFDEAEVDALLARIGDEALPDGADGREYDESIADEVEYHECPSCQHRWPK